ncbi:acyl-CoA carboxylase epsilon subunit [Streptomyces sp. NPDC048257]|uniref:acyl-CoA carboxylase epsilon subunit n=1 Tax=Streptomyces sp. NPDC048257 TaxID=3365526 RepID=UPI00371A0811
MTAPEAAQTPHTWRIVRGRPDTDETAAVLAVLTALLLNRATTPPPPPPRTTAAGWDRPPAGRTLRPGSWRRH